MRCIWLNIGLKAYGSRERRCFSWPKDTGTEAAADNVVVFTAIVGQRVRMRQVMKTYLRNSTGAVTPGAEKLSVSTEASSRKEIGQARLLRKFTVSMS